MRFAQQDFVRITGVINRHRLLLALMALLVCCLGCHQRLEDPASGELRGFLAQIPAGEAVFLDPTLNALLSKGVKAVSLPPEMLAPREIAPGVNSTTIRMPSPPEIYADEVKYLLLAGQPTESAFGCQAAAWSSLGQINGPNRQLYFLYRRKENANLLVAADLRPTRLVRIPAGVGVVGGTGTMPRREVKHPSYEMEETEATFAQFAAFLNEARPKESLLAQWVDLGRPDNPIVRYQGGYAALATCRDYPMAFVSFAGAKAYCERLGRRLPTSDEWEIAARGRDGRTYPWGEDPEVAKYANVAGAAAGQPHSSPVGAYPQGRGPYGLYDMAGNVFEWTTEDNGVSLRGGAWSVSADYARSAVRETNLPIVRNNHDGFRCAK